MPRLPIERLIAIDRLTLLKQDSPNAFFRVAGGAALQGGAARRP